MAITEQPRVITYHRRIIPTLKYWLLANILLALMVGVFNKPNTTADLLTSMGLINAVALSGRLMTKRLETISINEQEQLVEIKLDRFVFVTNTIKCPINDVFLGYHREHRTGGMLGNVFKIYHNGEIVAEALPGISGWTASTLQEIQEIIEIQKGKEYQQIS